MHDVVTHGDNKVYYGMTPNEFKAWMIDKKNKSNISV